MIIDNCQFPGSRGSKAIPIQSLILSLLAFGVPFAVYCWTMAHTWALDTIYTIDSAEMVIAAHTLGIDHPPGHPLYLILAHVFSRLPFASPDGGVILTSVLFGALAALFLSRALYERTGDAVASLAAGWTAAFGFIFWMHASIAEVYALQLAFLGLFLYLSAHWLRIRDGRTLTLLAFVLGLSATANILLTALLLPAFLFLLARSGALLENGAWQWKRVLKTALWGALGLTPFLYIPIRLAQESGFISDFVYLNGYEVQSPRWYWWYLSAEEFTTTKILDTPLSLYPTLARAYLRSYAVSASWLAPALAALGFGWMVLESLGNRRSATQGPASHSRRERRKAEAHARRSRSHSNREGIRMRVFARSTHTERVFDVTLTVAFLCTLLPVLSYQVPDRDVFFMPSFFFLTGLAGVGLHRAIRSVSLRLPRSIAPIGCAILPLALPLYLFAQHHSTVTQKTKDKTHYKNRLERFQKLPQDAIIVGEDDGHATRYKYFQMVCGLRPDITIHTLGRLAPRFRGDIPLDRSVAGAGDLRLGLNVADRLRTVRGLLEASPDRPLFAILDDRMPPEYGQFRTVRSPVDPYLLSIQPKPPAEESPSPLPVAVRSEGDGFAELRFVGFEIEGLDRGASRTFTSPLPVGGRPVDGIVQRGELFELTFVVRRTGKPGDKIFAEFAFVNDRMEIPSAHGFSASKQLEAIPEGLRDGWYRKDRFIFKIPGYIPGGRYTLAVRANRATGQIRGAYQGKPIRTLAPLRTVGPWMGQYDYRPLGHIWVE